MIAISPQTTFKCVENFIIRRPFVALALSNGLTLISLWVWRARAKGGVKKALIELLFSTLQTIPGAAGAVEKEQQAIVKKLEEKLIGDRDRWGIRNVTLPEHGIPEAKLLSVMKEWADAEKQNWKSGKVSGAVYHGGDQLTAMMIEAFKQFALSNPLHVDVFPAIRKMDAEIVSMVSNLFGGGETCGTMTSGGTESILMAVYAAREWAKATKGITQPEMVVPLTAHAAFEKAAHYFNIELVHCAIDPTTFRCDLNDMAKKITKNTILLVGSAPCFGPGVIDPIEGISKLALKGCGRGPLWVHVDCCLGSFVIACAREAGFPVAPFDFSVPGVTSISCDTHKYGFSLKGSSVVMYRNKSYRHYQYFTSSKWAGGIYATPALQGSRAGALTAACWAAMSHVGKSGYVEAAKKIITLAKGIESGIRDMKDLKVCGSPDLMVVSFMTTSKNISVHSLADAMSHRGWNLNTLQNPSAIHIAVTMMHCTPDMPKKFLDDLSSAVEEVKTKGKEPGGTAAIYGMAESVPAQVVDSLTNAFMDAVYTA